jgi:hypothetical protein
MGTTHRIIRGGLIENMKLGLHTYSLNMHGIGQAWAGFTCPWPRQLSTFQLLELLVDLDLEGVHLDDGVLENLDSGFLREVGSAARNAGLYLEYNFSMDLGAFGVGVQNDLEGAIANGGAPGGRHRQGGHGHAPTPPICRQPVSSKGRRAAEDGGKPAEIRGTTGRIA